MGLKVGNLYLNIPNKFRFPRKILICFISYKLYLSLGLFIDKLNENRLSNSIIRLERNRKDELVI